MASKTKRDKTKKDDVSQVIRDISVGDISNINGGVINVGSGNVQTGSTIDARQQIDTGGGAYIGGNVSLGGGTFIARDQINYAGAAPSSEMTAAFEKLTAAVQALSNPAQQTVAQMAVQNLQTEAAKGDAASEETVKNWFEMLIGMSPDIWDVAVTTFTNPIAGLSLAFKKIAEKAKAERAAKGQ
ncbi:MAG TPA: hypothetical protein PLT26_15615 [Anaerolineaceae bacterium]|nr:hypothetical protein [Anaerolineaceae bacterium]HQH86961.1 hypothetical protein [Anaerolineaceae bacterium]